MQTDCSSQFGQLFVRGRHGRHRARERSSGRLWAASDARPGCGEHLPSVPRSQRLTSTVRAALLIVHLSPACNLCCMDPPGGRQHASFHAGPFCSCKATRVLPRSLVAMGWRPCRHQVVDHVRPGRMCAPRRGCYSYANAALWSEEIKGNDRYGRKVRPKSKHTQGLDDGPVLTTQE